jgi:hypothetical protein
MIQPRLGGGYGYGVETGDGEAYSMWMVSLLLDVATGTADISLLLAETTFGDRPRLGPELQHAGGGRGLNSTTNDPSPTGRCHGTLRT